VMREIQGWPLKFAEKIEMTNPVRQQLFGGG